MRKRKAGKTPAIGIVLCPHPSLQNKKILQELHALLCSNPLGLNWRSSEAAHGTDGKMAAMISLPGSIIPFTGCASES